METNCGQSLFSSYYAVFRICEIHKDLGAFPPFYRVIISAADRNRLLILNPDAAFFLKKAANLDLEFEIEEDGVDMCESLKKRN